MCTSIRFTDNSGHMYLGRNGNVDRPAEKRKQQYDLFKRHGTSPLSLSRQGKQKDFRLHWRFAGGA